MPRLFLSLLLFAVAALPARAHFIWVLPPEGKDTKTARIVFSDTPKPDDAELLKKIARAEVFARDVDGKTVTLKYTEGKQAFNVAAPDAEAHEIGVVLHYGVSQHGDEPAFLLHYYAKCFTGIYPGRERADFKVIENLLLKPWDKLPLEIVPVITKDKQQCRVVWQGKPVADAEVMIYIPGQEKPTEAKTDKDGLFTFPRPEKSGLYGIRARHVEMKEGELDGKKYKEVRHYATLTVPVEVATKFDTVAPPVRATDVPKRAADPAATKLLAEARAARDLWNHFPGFTADIVVNLDGKTTKGTVKVSDKGDVEVTMPEGAAAKWAQEQLGSIVSHRFGGLPTSDTPCAFADDVTDHPLGRAIVVLNDEFHSSYRIKGREIMVVNRNMKDTHFTITVMENRLNEDNKYLSSIFTVNTWDNATGALLNNSTHHQEWKRVGKFDLPAGLTVVTASNGKLQARSFTLANWKLQ